jgi:hypothetical protein
LRGQQSVPQCQRKAAGELHELSARCHIPTHVSLFTLAQPLPIDLSEENNNMNRNNTKAKERSQLSFSFVSSPL